MGNQQIQTVICGVPLLVSYFPAKPLPRLSVIITVIALRLGDRLQKTVTNISGKSRSQRSNFSSWYGWKSSSYQPRTKPYQLRTTSYQSVPSRTTSYQLVPKGFSLAVLSPLFCELVRHLSVFSRELVRYLFAISS